MGGRAMSKAVTLSASDALRELEGLIHDVRHAAVLANVAHHDGFPTTDSRDEDALKSYVHHHLEAVADRLLAAFNEQWAAAAQHLRAAK